MIGSKNRKQITIRAGIVTLLIGVIVSACAIIEESEPGVEERVGHKVVGPVYTKGLVQEDSLQRIIAFQTNKKIMLLHQIKERDGVLVLDLTENESRELGIPESLYNEVIEMISAANENNK